MQIDPLVTVVVLPNNIGLVFGAESIKPKPMVVESIPIHHHVLGGGYQVGKRNKDIPSRMPLLI